ncbi:hypothetical protein Taro_020145, partial [Colocasia esculenta]|nr:hypothetical protein [Colocasia esculenta]
MVQKAQLVEDTMAKVEGMRGKDNSKPVFVKKGAPNIAPTFRKNNVNNNNKRPNAGRDVAGDKRVKVEGRQLAENCKFCDKPGHPAEECWKKLGACLKCGGRDHRIPDCPMLKDQPIRAQNVPRQRPPRSPSSGLLGDLHSKETSGRSSPSVQLASCRGRWPDSASKGQIFGCKVGVFSQLPLGFFSSYFSLAKGEERVGEGRSGFNIWERPLSHSQGDKMALRAVGDSSPMGELPCFWNFGLCNACRSEKSASTSLDARISVGVHGWTLTPPQRLGVDANLAFGQNSKTCRKPCIPCIYTCNMYM